MPSPHQAAVSILANADIAASLPNNPRAFDTCHRPPRCVSIPRTLSSAAIARSVVAPLARMSAMTGARSRAKRTALALTVTRSSAPPLPARLSAAAPFGLSGFEDQRRGHSTRKGQISVTDPVASPVTYGSNDVRLCNPKRTQS
jgi:hypothetical protein